MKLQAPTSRLQRTTRQQLPIVHRGIVRCLGLVTWCFSGSWLLDLGACLMLLFSPCSSTILAAEPPPEFNQGLAAYRAADYGRAIESFNRAAAMRPASGTFQNLGLAAWHQGQLGEAIVAWERALWLDPFNAPARVNLRFARKAAQLEVPELSWNEVVSTWLPVNWWAWIAGVSLWLTIAMGTLPGVFRLPKRAWHQALMAFGLMIFLLSLPAHLGVQTRSNLGFVLQKDTPLRLTPTAEAQAITRLNPGDPVRALRTRGHFVLVRASRTKGWLQRDQLGLLCPDDRR